MNREPRIYTDMSVAEYFKDPAPEPSLTQSIAKVMLDKSPLHAWYAHPRLNPDYEADDDTKFDLGNVSHTLLIGRGKDVVALPEEYADWRKQAAKDLRDRYRVEGKLAVLQTQYARAQRMVTAAREQLELRDKGYLFGEIEAGETVLIWEEKIGGQTIFCRQMIDYLGSPRPTDAGWIFADYKTTDENCAPWALGRKLVADGWHIQAAMTERGLVALGHRRPAHFYFVVQETTPPYSLNVVDISETALTMGRKQLDVATRIWARCMKDNRWPGYPLQTVVPDYPEWAQAQWLTREETEFANDLLAAG